MIGPIGPSLGSTVDVCNTLQPLTKPAEAGEASFEEMLSASMAELKNHPTPHVRSKFAPPADPGSRDPALSPAWAAQQLTQIRDAMATALREVTDIRV